MEPKRTLWLKRLMVASVILWLASGIFYAMIPASQQETRAIYYTSK